MRCPPQAVRATLASALPRRRWQPGGAAAWDPGCPIGSVAGSGGRGRHRVRHREIGPWGRGLTRHASNPGCPRSPQGSAPLVGWSRHSGSDGLAHLAASRSITCTDYSCRRATRRPQASFWRSSLTRLSRLPQCLRPAPPWQRPRLHWRGSGRLRGRVRSMPAGTHYQLGRPAGHCAA
jgi:hypothetical protein